MNILKMAWRNVWRNRRRTVVTIGAMALALFAMMQYAGLVNGYKAGLYRSILDQELGNVQVHHREFLDKPSIYNTIETPEALVSRIRGIGNGVNASFRLFGQGLAASEENSAGVLFKGVDPQRDKTISGIHERVVEGKWLSPEAPRGVVVGKFLARNLGLEVGTELVILAQAANGAMANDLFKVRGILGTVGNKVDRSGLFMGVSAYRELMVLDDVAHQIIVRYSGPMSDEALGAKVAAVSGDLDVRTWRVLSPELATMLDYMDTVMFFMFLIVYLAIGIVVLNAMLMAVFERIREFGVLKALGVGPVGVLGMVFAETFFQLGIAVVVAAVLSVPAGYYMAIYGIDLSGQMDAISLSGVGVDAIWKSSFDVRTVTVPVATLLVVVLFSVLYPAFKAALIRPVRAIAHR